MTYPDVHPKMIMRFIFHLWPHCNYRFFSSTHSLSSGLSVRARPDRIFFFSTLWWPDDNSFVETSYAWLTVAFINSNRTPTNLDLSCYKRFNTWNQSGVLLLILLFADIFYHHSENNLVDLKAFLVRCVAYFSRLACFNDRCEQDWVS